MFCPEVENVHINFIVTQIIHTMKRADKCHCIPPNNFFLAWLLIIISQIADTHTVKHKSLLASQHEFSLLSFLYKDYENVPDSSRLVTENIAMFFFYHFKSFENPPIIHANLRTLTHLHYRSAQTLRSNGQTATSHLFLFFHLCTKA